MDGYGSKIRKVSRSTHVSNDTIQATMQEFLLQKYLAPVQSITDIVLHLFFYKELGSGLSPQSCLYFQGFRGSKLLNGCLVVWQYVCGE